MIIDSNVLIGYLNGDESIRASLHSFRESGTVFFITHVSVIEALSLPALNDIDIVAIGTFLNDYVIIPLDMEISRVAARLRRIHKLALADSIIVATAQINNLPLATRDKKMRAVPSVVFAEI